MSPGSATVELLDALAELGFDVHTGVEPTALEELGFAMPARVEVTPVEELSFIAPLVPSPAPAFAPPWPPPPPATIVMPTNAPDRPTTELATFVAAVPLLPVEDAPEADRVAPQLPPMPREPMPERPLDSPVRVGAAPWVASSPPWDTTDEAPAEPRVMAPAMSPPPPVPAPTRRSWRPVVLAGLAAFVIGFGAGWGTNWLTGGHNRAEIAPAVIVAQTMVSRNDTSAAGSFTMTPWA
jgi:hypothetical protein